MTPRHPSIRVDDTIDAEKVGNRVENATDLPNFVRTRAEPRYLNGSRPIGPLPKPTLVRLTTSVISLGHKVEDGEYDCRVASL